MADEEESVQIKLDPAEFARVLRELKAVEPKLATGIRKSIRVAAKLIMTDVAAEIRSYPAARYQTGMRDKLAQSLAVRINSGTGARQGVAIVSTGRLLPQNKKALVKAMNRATFRHPVYARTGARRNGRQFIDQDGMRYFRQSIVTRHEGEVNRMINEALDQAVQTLA